VLAIIWVALIAAALNWGAADRTLHLRHPQGAQRDQVNSGSARGPVHLHSTREELSYFGYQFEVPWNDIDETQTKLIRATTHSGCSHIPVWFAIDGDRHSGGPMGSRAFPQTFISPRDRLEAAFAKEATQSDYSSTRCCTSLPRQDGRLVSVLSRP